jgi:two-component system, OmpR family, response regulator
MTTRKVLIIDDEQDLCHLMKSFLLPLGFTVYTAHTLKDGLDAVKNVSPEIIFLDNNLPDGFGWDHITEMKEAVPECNITLMSAFKNANHIKHNEDIHILEKPISLNRLTVHLGNM